MEEVEAKWLEGPFNELPAGAIVSRRFGVVQMTPSGDRKVRLIDDFSASGGTVVFRLNVRLRSTLLMSLAH